MNPGRTIVSAIVGGLVIFVWGAIHHMATPLGHMGLSTINPTAEPALLAAMKQSLTAPGLYFYPGMNMVSPTEEEQRACEEKVKTGPSGLLLYKPSDGKMMDPMQLVTEFVSNVVAALLLAVILAGRKMGRGAAAMLGLAVGLFGWVSLDVSYWNWYGFPNGFAFSSLVEQSVGGLLCGLTISLVQGRAKAA